MLRINTRRKLNILFHSVVVVVAVCLEHCHSLIDRLNNVIVFIAYMISHGCVFANNLVDAFQDVLYCLVC